MPVVAGAVPDQSRAVAPSVAVLPRGEIADHADRPGAPAVAAIEIDGRLRVVVRVVSLITPRPVVVKAGNVLNCRVVGLGHVTMMRQMVADRQRHGQVEHPVLDLAGKRGIRQNLEALIIELWFLATPVAEGSLGVDQRFAVGISQTERRDVFAPLQAAVRPCPAVREQVIHHVRRQERPLARGDFLHGHDRERTRVIRLIHAADRPLTA